MSVIVIDNVPVAQATECAAAYQPNPHRPLPNSGPVEIQASNNGGTSNVFRFVGRFGVTDEGYGWLIMGSRDYDAALGRFTKADPVRMLGGLNYYSYADNNPGSYIDPVGLFKFSPQGAN